MYNKVKDKIFHIIEPSDDQNLSKIFDQFIMGLISLSVIAIIMESFKPFSLKYKDYFYIFEVFSVTVFTLEYLLRVWTASLKHKNCSKTKAVIRYIFSPMAIIDLLAIIPFYLPMFIAVDLRFLRVLRLARVMRIFKITRYVESMNLFTKVLKDKKEELFITIFMTFLLLLLASSLMFYIEHDQQPKAFPNILESFWWAIATLTTVGYGDVYPVTGWGRLLSGVIALLGIGLVALPTGILSSAFMDEIATRKLEKKGKNCIDNEEKVEKDPISYCPYCGKKLPEHIDK